MRTLVARSISDCSLLFGAAGCVEAGGIHIRYGLDAPEKLATSNILYYEGVLNLEHHHPLEFAYDHPFYTKMFEDPLMLDKLLERWEAHEQRFKYWHDCLWKVLDGYRASRPELAGQLIAPGPGAGIELGGVVVADRGLHLPEGSGPGSNHPGGGGGGVTALSVPEPSTALLLALGVVLGGSWVVFRRSSDGRRSGRDGVLSPTPQGGIVRSSHRER
jgi:hypothetical protein